MALAPSSSHTVSSTDVSKTSNNYKVALESYITELQTEYEQWYESSQSKVAAAYAVLQLTALLSGFLSSIIAAIATPEAYSSWARILLIILPAFGSLAAGLLVQFRVYDLLRLREEGRIEFQDLVTWGRRMLAQSTSEEEYAKIYYELHTRTTQIEKSQCKQFFGLSRGDFVAQYSPQTSSTLRQSSEATIDKSID